MKNLGFVICVLLSLTACTITKRQHLGGWHVEWKHHHKTNRGTENQDSFVAVGEQNTTTSQPEYSVVDSMNVASNGNSVYLEKQELPVAVGYSGQLVKKTANHHQLQKVTEILSLKMPIKKLTKSIRLLRSASETQDFFVMTVLLIVLGSCLLLLALLFLFLEVLSGSFGTPFLAYSGITFAGGLIMIVVGIVLGAKTAADSKKHKDKEKPERVKKEKEKTQEEKDEAMWAQYKRAVRATIILAVLFFALSLFFIAIDSVIPLVPIMAILFVIFILLVWGRYKQKIKEAEGTVQPKRV